MMNINQFINKIILKKINNEKEILDNLENKK